MSKQHTPGPWTINGCSHQYEGVVSGGAHLIENEEVGAVCLMIDTDDSRVCEANAHLIANAPTTADRLERAVALLREVLHLPDGDLRAMAKKCKYSVRDSAGFSFEVHMAARGKARAFLAEVEA